MTELRTGEALLSALRTASTRGPSAKELHEQRVSFIMGSVKESSSLTRARVERVLAKQEGRKISK
jgi:hypothetical protein